jgi:hypothetical protein
MMALTFDDRLEAFLVSSGLATTACPEEQFVGTDGRIRVQLSNGVIVRQDDLDFVVEPPAERDEVAGVEPEPMEMTMTTATQTTTTAKAPAKRRAATKAPSAKAKPAKVTKPVKASKAPKPVVAQPLEQLVIEAKSVKPKPEPKRVRDDRGLIPGTKLAAVYDLLVREGGATTDEIREAANTKYIRQACDQLSKTLPGFKGACSRGEDGVMHWTGTLTS